MHLIPNVSGPAPCAAVVNSAPGESASAAKAPNRPRAARGPDLRNAALRARSFLGMSLEGADLDGADLRDADLRGADLFGARLRRADLRGARFDMTRLLDIWVPKNLDLVIANQIRAFDFRLVMPRKVEAGDLPLPCPYRDATVKPILYEWGSRTWNGGRGYAEPKELWTLEEICGAVLTALECRHDLLLPAALRPFGARAAFA